MIDPFTKSPVPENCPERLRPVASRAVALGYKVLEARLLDGRCWLSLGERRHDRPGAKRRQFVRRRLGIYLERLPLVLAELPPAGSPEGDWRAFEERLYGENREHKLLTLWDLLAPAMLEQVVKDRREREGG